MKKHNLLLVAAVLGGTAALVRLSGANIKDPRLAGSPSTYGATDGEPATAPANSFPPTDCIEPACKVMALPRSPHAVRLTHAQWENTVRDLLHLQAAPGFSTSFPADPAPSGEEFGLDSANLVVATHAIWQAYRDAAEALALRMVEDPAAIDKILPAAAKTGRGDIHTRLRAFVSDFLPRAYRRPVQDAEIDALVALGEKAAAADTTSDPFLIRIRWMLTAILQAPSFLYRVEGGAAHLAASDDSRPRLDDYALASKLSYALWGTMPDDQLTGYAQSKQLATNDGLAAVVQEMLADPRAAWALTHFHEQWLGVDKFGRILRQTGDFPKFYPNFGRDAQEDIRRTIKELVIDNPGTVQDLYSSDIAYVNANLAKVYGIDPATTPGLNTSPDSFVRVRMPDQRVGILMHVGWLAMQSHPKDPSSIQRGVFMARRVLCLPLGSPPAGALNTKIEGPRGSTNRGRVEATTQVASGCKGCHGRVINPMGFAFEAFDALGTFRTHDGDSAVDTTGTTELLGAFDGATAMLTVARETPNAHACYAAQWSAYLNGTPTVQATSKWLSPLVDKSMKGAPVRDIVAELVQTDAFVTASR